MINIKDYIADIPDFPKAGILFRDLTPILENNEAFSYVTDELVKKVNECYPGTTHILAPEARGFWFGCPVAVNGGFSFVPVRKPGKLPRETRNVEYVLEYGTESLCIHKNSLKPGDKVVIIDDLLATGGTLKALQTLAEDSGADVLGFLVVVELVDLKGRSFTEKRVEALLEL